MKIPKKIKIGGWKIDIIYDAEYCKKHGDLWGRIDPREGRIYLDNTLDKEALKLSFLHECIHYFNICLGKQGVKTYTDGEEYVWQLASILNEFIPQTI